ncbi:MULTISPECIES: hypothetical protein [Streptomyces]|uniref:Peptidoglycan-binding protein n=2 Tax=Streptomyces viridosporus TaxID=67581 RepID=A0ABX6A8T3_STRVD|nr:MULTISPECIES: hypothetical protein [Streptomyces]EFE71320.1 predicted protein [Streptomyces viridosporus ATCC 14672]PWJ08236.1 hypothetical protein DKG34_06995 [Streptomyces sp. NWU49]QEU84101.1 hypothetical protein CP969_04950 [Streptomyces viridosporus T7A]
MTAQRPDDGGTPKDQGGVPSLPEDVWQRFLTDNEHAIRASAPREPSARQRASARWPQPPHTDGGTREHDDAADAVGDLWHPDDPWEGPSWRDLDARARLRRVGRVAGTAAAIALALGAWSLLSTGAGAPAGGPGDTVLQQSENVPAELPTATSLPAGLVSPSPSAPVVRSG